MSGDPIRWTDARAEAPEELLRLVRSADAPPPLPPEIRFGVRARLTRATPAPRPPSRWIAPGVVAAAAVIAGLVLWWFRPTTEAPALTAEAPAPVGPTESVPPTPSEATPAPAGGDPVAPTPSATLQIAVHGGWGDVYLDGRALGESPQDVTVAVGQHTVEVRFPNAEIASRTLRVEAGVRRVFFDAPAPSPPVATPPDPPRPPPAASPPAATPPAPPRRAADIRAAVSAHRAGVERCHARHPSTQGGRVRITLALTIAADGRVSSARVDGGGSAALHRCVERDARTWRLARAREATSVQIPFVFDGGQSARATAQGATGTLLINTVPWARVYLDGELIGNTPIRRTGVPVGRHRLRLVANDGTEHTQTIVVRPDETLRIVRQM